MRPAALAQHSKKPGGPRAYRVHMQKVRSRVAGSVLTGMTMRLGIHQQSIVAYVKAHQGCTLSELMGTTPMLCTGNMSVGGGWYRPWSAHQDRINKLVAKGVIACSAGRYTKSN